MIYGHRVNCCNQKPSSEQHPGPFFFFCPFFCAAACLHFLSIHAEAFRTAINSVLIWVCSPTGLAKPFIILRAWNSTAPSQVVAVNTGPGSFHFAIEEGDTVVWRFCHPSVCQMRCFFYTGVKAKWKCHLRKLICHRATAWIEWWQRGPLLFFSEGQLLLNLERSVQPGPKNSLYLANEE